MSDTNVAVTGDGGVLLVEGDDDIIQEIGYGILGRAMDIHDNPDDEFEDVARELRDVAMGIIDDLEVDKV